MSLLHYIELEFPAVAVIKWTLPTEAYLRDEAYEYLDNDFARTWLRQNWGLELADEDEVLDLLQAGTPVEVDAKTFTLLGERGRLVNATWRPRDFQSEVAADPEYAASARSMTKAMTKTGAGLPMPILLKKGTTAFLLAGNRRTNVAFGSGVPVTFWVVDVQTWQRQQRRGGREYGEAAATEVAGWLKPGSGKWVQLGVDETHDDSARAMKTTTPKMLKDGWVRLHVMPTVVGIDTDMKPPRYKFEGVREFLHENMPWTKRKLDVFWLASTENRQWAFYNGLFNLADTINDGIPVDGTDIEL